MKYERERMTGVRCQNYRCQYNDRGFEQSCSAAHADDDECIVPVCQLYEPEVVGGSDTEGKR